MDNAHPMLESDYPFTSGGGDDSADCLYSATTATDVNVYDWHYINPYDYGSDNLIASVSRQPVAVVLAANSKYIHSYASGVIDADDCY